MTIGVGLDDRLDRHARPGAVAAGRARLATSASRSISSQAVRGSGGRPAAASRASIGAAHAGSAAVGPRGVGARRRGPPNPSRLLARRRSADGREALARERRSPSGRSEASRPASPSRSRTASPASAVEVDAEPGGGERRRGPGRAARRSCPARTSPVPPLASAGFSNGAIATVAVRRRDDGPRALEDDDLAPGRGRGIAGGGDAGGVVADEVAVGGRVAAAPGPQAGELAGVRRQDAPAGRPPSHQSSIVASERSASASRTIGAAVRPRRAASSSRTSSAVARPGRRPGPDHDRVVLVVEDPGERGLRVDLLDVVLGQRHRRRLDDLRREQRLERLRDRERHEAGAGATGGAADEQRGARVVERPGDHEQLAERALVAAHRSLGEERAPRRRRRGGRRRPGPSS